MRPNRRLKTFHKSSKKFNYPICLSIAVCGRQHRLLRRCARHDCVSSGPQTVSYSLQPAVAVVYAATHRRVRPHGDAASPAADPWAPTSRGGRSGGSGARGAVWRWCWGWLAAGCCCCCRAGTGARWGGGPAAGHAARREARQQWVASSSERQRVLAVVVFVPVVLRVVLPDRSLLLQDLLAEMVLPTLRQARVEVVL